MTVVAADVEQARVLHQRGVVSVQQGKPDAAEAALSEALRLVGGLDPSPESDTLHARVLITLGYVDFELRGAAAALSRLDGAVDFVAARRVAGVSCALRLQRALVHLQSGRLDSALTEFERGAAEFADAPVGDRVSLLNNRAVTHIRMNDLDAARRDLHRSIAESTAAGMPNHTLKATHNLGAVEYLSGDLPRALDLMNAAEAMDPELAPAVSLLSKAQVLVAAGLLTEADQALSTAGDTFVRDRLWSFVPETELERARCAAARGDIALTRRLATSALDRFREQGHETWRRSAERLLLQAELADQTVPPDLVGLLARAQQLHRETVALDLPPAGRDTALIVAEIQLAAGAVRDAAVTVAQSLPMTATDSITSRMHDHHVRARVAAATGDRRGATARVRRAMDELARYQSSFGSVDLRTASAVHGRRLADLDVILALQSGRPAAVFAAAERARASSSRLTPVRPPEDEAAARLLAELRQTVEALREAGPDRSAAEPLAHRRQELERQIRARSWALPGGGRPVRPAGPTDVRSRLHRVDRTMLVLLGSQSRLYAVSVGQRMTVHELGPTAPVVESLLRVRADLDVSARPHLPAPIRAAVAGSLVRSLARLDAVLAPALSAHRSSGVVVVTTGVLSGLPWGLLPSLRGVPVTVAPSATKWMACLDSVRTAGAPRVAAVAGPDVAAGAVEAGEVARLWAGARTVTGADASVAGFGELVGSCDVLHVAAHGFHQSESPLFSSLRMTDGSVFAHDLTAAPAHVVLSACQVGLATVRPGDEALGMASALLHLGARSVIASVALVADDVAARTMTAYHRRLAGGAPSDVALAATLAEAGEAGEAGAPPFVELGAAWQAT